MSREDIHGFDGVRINVGLSAIIGVTVPAFQNALIVKLISGGSLEIGGTALLWGQGYLFSEPTSMNAAGTFYLCATNATCVVGLFKGYGN